MPCDSLRDAETMSEITSEAADEAIDGVKASAKPDPRLRAYVKHWYTDATPGKRHDRSAYTRVGGVHYRFFDMVWMKIFARDDVEAARCLLEHSDAAGATRGHGGVGDAIIETEDLRYVRSLDMWTLLNAHWLMRECFRET